jgi:hypothetical protein
MLNRSSNENMLLVVFTHLYSQKPSNQRPQVRSVLLLKRLYRCKQIVLRESGEGFPHAQKTEAVTSQISTHLLGTFLTVDNF